MKSSIEVSKDGFIDFDAIDRLSFKPPLTYTIRQNAVEQKLKIIE